jgi:K+-sensing histidine kinase KdpD
MDESILEKINESGVKLLTPLTIEETYETIVKEAIQLARADDGMIYVAENDELIKKYASTKLADEVIIRKKGNAYTSYKTHKAFVKSADDFETYHPNIKAQGIKAAAFIPVSYKNTSTGVMVIRSYNENVFTKRELQILKLFGSMASFAIRKAQLYAETKRAVEVRDLFISIASHELRTPLTALNGYIQLLNSRMKDKDTTESKYVQELMVESSRLTNLVKELLEVNRIKQGQLQLNLRECYMHEIIEQAIERLQFKESNREVVFENKVKAKQDVVIADAEKLLQVFSSILNNSYKFSKADSKITITLSLKSKQLITTISDEGKGMDGTDLSRVFEGFYKGFDNHQEGMGVGLMLAKHIIESHYGKIGIHSEVQKGTTIEVTLPQTKI